MVIIPNPNRRIIIVGIVTEFYVSSEQICLRLLNRGRRRNHHWQCGHRRGEESGEKCDKFLSRIRQTALVCVLTSIPRAEQGVTSKASRK